MSPLPIVFLTLQKNSREHVRIALDEYKGAVRVDARLYFDGGSGELRPTSKGITIRPEFLPRVIAALQEAERELRARGLMEV
jgi:hypothetical protein